MGIDEGLCLGELCTGDGCWPSGTPKIAKIMKFSFSFWRWQNFKVQFLCKKTTVETIKRTETFKILFNNGMATWKVKIIQHAYELVLCAVNSRVIANNYSLPTDLLCIIFIEQSYNVCIIQFFPFMVQVYVPLPLRSESDLFPVVTIRPLSVPVSLPLWPFSLLVHDSAVRVPSLG